MEVQFFLAGSVAGHSRIWPLDRRRMRVGRSPSNTIQLQDDTVSREQAEILAEGGAWILRDLGGKNVTRVNGAPVKRPVALHLGDRIAVGRVVLHVTDGDTAAPTPLSESESLETAMEVPAAEFLRRGVGGAARPTAVVRALADAGSILVKDGPLEEACGELLRVIEAMIPASRLILVARRQPESPPVQIAARSRGQATPDPLLLSRGILDAVLESGTSVITMDALSDPRFFSRDSVVALRTRSAMAVPLYDSGRILGLLYADEDDPGIQYKRRDLELLTLVGNMIAVKVANDHLVEAQRNLCRIEQELATAGEIQRGLLAAPLPSIAGYDCHAVVQSCEDVGGDLYDFHPMPDGSVYFLVGDVSGKGITAALVMCHFLAFADALYEHCEEPEELATRLSALMARRVEGPHFVTAFVGRLSPERDLLRYANAGHPYPLVIAPDTIQELESTGPPCGAVAGAVYTGGTVHLAPGALLAVFSDGIPEARRGEEEWFGLDRLRRLLVAGSRSPTLGTLSQQVIEHVDSFLDGGARSDDIALLLLRKILPG